MAKKSIIYPEIENIFDDNPLISKEEVLDLMLKSGLSKNKEPKQTYNRAIRKVFADRGGDIETRLTKDIVIQSFNGQSKISDEEFAKDDFIDSFDDKDEADEKIWNRKLLKTGKTKNPEWGKTGENIEIYTFVNNEQDEYYNSESWWYDQLLYAVQKKIFTLNYIDDDGYQSDFVYESEVESAYVYPYANLRIGGTFETVML